MYLASKQYVKITAPMGPPGNVHFRGTGFGPLLEALLLPSSPAKKDNNFRQKLAVMRQEEADKKNLVNSPKIKYGKETGM